MPELWQIVFIQIKTWCYKNKLKTLKPEINAFVDKNSKQWNIPVFIAQRLVSHLLFFWKKSGKLSTALFAVFWQSSI